MKKTQEEISAEFVARDCELIGEYINNSLPVEFKCRCGNTSTISYKSFKRGSYCLVCSGKQKKTIKDVKQFIEQSGYKLLDTQYFNAFHVMKTICPKAHLYETHWNNFQQGRRCLICQTQKLTDAKKLTYSEVNQEFDKRDCTLITKEYQGNQQKLDYICSCGSQSIITLANLKTGHKCQNCRIEEMSGPNHPNWIKDREEARLRDMVRRRAQTMLKNVIRLIGTRKDARSAKLLGYGPKELKDHIINHPNWNNIKDTKWHLDHIFPIKAFCDYKITDLSLINCLENLQPLEGRENLKKSSKYNKAKFESWLKTKR